MVVKALGSQGKESFAKSAALRDAAFACDDPLRLTPALVALKDADFQTLDRMGRSSNQMRIAPALAAAKRCNEFVIRHNKGMIFHANPPATARARSLPAILGASSALRRPGPPTKRAWPARKMASKRRRLYADLFCSPQLGDGTLDESRVGESSPRRKFPSLGTPHRLSFRDGSRPPRFGGLVILLQIIDGAVWVRE